MDGGDKALLAGFTAFLIGFAAIAGWGWVDSSYQTYADNECRAIGYSRGYWSQGRGYCVREHVSPLERPATLGAR